MTRSVNKNVMSGTMKYAFVRKARDNSVVADATDQNCTTKGSELYLWRYIFD